MSYVVGDTKVFEFTFTRRVNGVYVAWDPTLVVISILKVGTTTAEEAITFGGADPLDDDLIRTAAGSYALTYTLDVPGVWAIRAMDVDTVGAKSWPTKQTGETRFRVEADSHTYADSPL